MNWKFWKEDVAGNTAKSKKLSKPKEPPQAVGRKLIVDLKVDPDEAWSLRYVSRPSESKPGTQDFRLYDPGKAIYAGLPIKDWNSLNDRNDLILYEGCYDKGGGSVELWSLLNSRA